MMGQIPYTRSCSTMVASGKCTKSGNIIFGKNSDRPVNEAQPLCYYPPADHAKGEMVECSFIKIPQVEHTYGCIGSRPHVFFGFEHGVNEHGVMIGNEQVSGREIPERRWGLIGMDILRLALERSRTAREALDVIANLLETVGTGGDPAYRIAPFNSNYVIADGKEAFLFESHQRDWVAKKVEDVGFLSNCYSIQSDYTFIADKAIANAVKNGWANSECLFNPAKAWTKDDCIFAESEGFVRYARLKELMNKSRQITPEMIMSNLRDHYDGVELLSSIYSSAAAKIPCICSHPGGVSGCATAASAVTVLRDSVPEELKFTMWTSMAPPCCSIFRPIYNVGEIPEALSGAHALYDEKENWWTFIELERYISLNYEKWAVDVKATFRKLEKEFLDEAEYIEKNYSGNKQELIEFSRKTVKESYGVARSLIEKIKMSMKTVDIDRMLIDYFVSTAAGCGMKYDGNVIK